MLLDIDSLPDNLRALNSLGAPDRVFAATGLRSGFRDAPLRRARVLFVGDPSPHRR